MAKKQLPNGFTSWIEFYDYLKRTNPKLVHDSKTTIQFLDYVNPVQHSNNVVEKYSINVATLERLCWRELQYMRVNKVDMAYFKYVIASHPNTTGKNVNQFINLITKISV